MIEAIKEILLHVPPAIIMILGGMLLPLFPVNSRRAAVLLLPVITLLQVWNIPVGEDMLRVHIAGFDLRPLYAHPYTHIFATIFAIASFAGGLFGLMHSKTIETSSAFIYAGGALGVVFSGDFISLFFYWELMAIGSTLVVMASSNKAAKGAAVRYAAVHFLGGAILMAGIASHIMLTGDAGVKAFDGVDMSIMLHFEAMDMSTIAIWLVLVGVLINAAVPPLSAWLPDAYPVSSPFGGVYLSAFTTKTAVFVLLTLFPGNHIVMFAGLFMIFYGIIMAILENDMRRILAYSIINQVGFMLTGIGIGTQMALNGTATHAFCHIIYKALLFMSAGSVLHMTGKSRCSDLGGLYRTMRVTAVCGIIGALSISAFPLTSGFVSKSMITTAAADEYLKITWFMLVAASAGVFLHAGIKFPWFVFFQKDSGMRPKDPPINMQAAMILLSILCIVPAIPGVAEQTLYRLLPVAAEYVSYTTEHVVTQLQLLLFSGLAFFLMLPLLKRTKTITLDFDWLYRGFGRYIALAFMLSFKFPVRYGRILLKKFMKGGVRVMVYSGGPMGVMARSWPIGRTALWTVALLGAYLVLYYL